MQPFIAIKTKGGEYFRDNSNLGSRGIFYYPFFFDTIEFDKVDSIGIALTSTDGTVWTTILSTNDLDNFRVGDKVDLSLSVR